MEKVDASARVPRLPGVTRHKIEIQAQKKLRTKPGTVLALLFAFCFGILGFLGATDAWILAVFSMFFALVISLPRRASLRASELGLSNTTEREFMIGTPEHRAKHDRFKEPGEI